MLKDLDPIEQVVGQVYFTSRAMEEDLARVDEVRKVQVGYEEFCAAPRRVFYRIIERFAQQGCAVEWEYKGPEQFQPTNQIRLPRRECERICAAYRRFSGESLSL